MGWLVLLVSVIVLSVAMSNGIRTTTTVGAAGAPGPAASTTQQAAIEVATPPPVATAAAATTTVASSEQTSHLDDPYKDSERKVPNGPDPIHNRRARWGEAPARRV